MKKTDGDERLKSNEPRIRSTGESEDQTRRKDQESESWQRKEKRRSR